MIKKLLDRMGYAKKLKETLPVATNRRPRQILSTDDFGMDAMQNRIDAVLETSYRDSITPELKQTLKIASDTPKFAFAMDSGQSIKAGFRGSEVLPVPQLLWYANQTFIGYQLCAILSQNWLIAKACLVPAEDAVRKGYDLTVNDGSEVDTDVLDEIKKLDVEFNIVDNMREFVKFGRTFGIRVAMFKVDSTDPEYYFKPFNEDGITEGSYRGISQIDPYWITPQLSPQAAGDPSAIDFYEPTWWNIAGKLIHRTHLIIYRTEEVPDILKPTYIYGGIPIPQKIAERVYAAERTANEAPMLALTKRTDVINVDLAQAVANEPNNPVSNQGFHSRIQHWVYNRDNYGIKVLGLDEKMQQFDTSLADLDDVIMTQYQLVAAASNVPAVKLLGTSPKGFNATGEHEESSYHEMLESIQANSLTPLLQRHHLLLIRSHVAPRFKIAPFGTTVAWKPMDAMTGKELAELNKMKAETGQTLMASGAIDGQDERERIITDPDSGYNGLLSDDVDVIEPLEVEGSDPEGSGSL